MDFLDPHFRRSKKIRLFVGYFLMTLVLALATTILIYGAYGYGFDTKNGQIIQNGLVFVESHPSGAEIYLNGQDKNAATSARLTLQSGNYDLTLKKSGYRDWGKHFTLQENSVARYVYPFLFPVNPTSTNLKTYASLPPLFTETPSRHWLLVQVPPSGLPTINFDEFDLTHLTKPSVSLTMPSDLLSGDGQDGASLKIVQWSTDNNNLLLEHDFSGQTEFVLFNRADPTTSINLNRLFKTSPAQVSLVNNKTKQLLLLSNQQDLSIGTVSSGGLGTPILRHVTGFSDYSGDTVLYATVFGQPAGHIQAKIWKAGKSYPLASFSIGTSVLLDSAQYQGIPYFVAGTDTSRIDIFQDPLAQISDASIGRAIPTLAFNISGVDRISFSPNARFVEAEAGPNFAVYDLEDDQNYQYKLAEPLAAEPVWMDGHHLIGETGGQVFVTEFDNTNHQTLVPTTLPVGALFSPDYNHLLTIQELSPGSLSLVNVDMRAGKDLPKSGTSGQ